MEKFFFYLYIMILSEFLKKYSTISVKFIDDFFNMYEYKTSNYDFVIDLNKVVKWLKTRKDSIKKTLVQTYVIDVDYMITKIGTKGRPSEQIMITPECFKRLCMLSKTEKAESVRTYFINIEKLIDKYKNTIIEDLSKKVGVLENNQKPIINPKKGVIYVLQSNKTIDDTFKLGRSKKFIQRLLSHNSIEEDNLKIKLLYETDNIKQVENCVKNALKTKQYRKKKEIFQVDIDIIKQTIEQCEEIICRVNNNKSKSKNKVKIILNKNEGNLFMLFIEKELK